jgi:hypothetical protein
MGKGAMAMPPKTKAGMMILSVSPEIREQYQFSF